MIQIKTIDGVLLRDMLIAGTTMLQNNREKVDALNVFPVPDGDTGTNMSLTISSAMKEINLRENIKAGDAAHAIAKGALKGARGNSGVILSQLFRGFAKELADVEKITPVQFAKALKNGSDTAYKAVMKPKEGTILTVARVVAEEAMKQAEADPNNYDALFNVILKSGETILKKTQQMLPVLKQAGVVDAGGMGLLYIYNGYAATLRGEELPTCDISSSNAADFAEYADDHGDIEDIKFVYCTEFIVQELKDEVTNEIVDRFRRRLNRIGDCVFVVNDLGLIKVHVHTNEPGKVLQYAVEMGELDQIKIDNMVEERRQKMQNQAPIPPKKFGMVAVSLGDGFSKIYKDLMVDKIVDGGQTMNPSIDDLTHAIDSVNAETIFVFPNNSNIIMAAEQAAELSKKEVHVIKTKNVAMGIAAAVAFQPETTTELNLKRMEAASEQVRTGMVTFAIR
ncbi:MAG: DAK2 domain-containing protein, partial [Christensenellaceae bacterium]|nr:DAK2 domain-containing protein [Christensenellaceae bacterium]